jgi:hypothetical protein
LKWTTKFHAPLGCPSFLAMPSLSGGFHSCYCHWCSLGVIAQLFPTQWPLFLPYSLVLSLTTVWKANKSLIWPCTSNDLCHGRWGHLLRRCCIDKSLPYTTWIKLNHTSWLWSNLWDVLRALALLQGMGHTLVFGQPQQLRKPFVLICKRHTALHLAHTNIRVIQRSI